MIRWVAEIGSNHSGTLSRAKRLITRAKQIGCTDVKFQLFNSEIGKPEREWLPIAWLPELRDFAHEDELGFGCSPFYMDAVDELEPYVDFYKIANSQIYNVDLIRKCYDTGKPMVLSIRPDVDCDFLFQEFGYGDRMTFLHCIPDYPTQIDRAGLIYIGILSEQWANVGYSDHTACPSVIYRAIHKWEANMIELHLDLDGLGWEFYHGHCWLPDNVEYLIKAVNKGLEAD